MLGEPSPVIETARLVLRRFTHADAPLVLELLNDPAWLRFIGDRKVRSLDDARAYIAEKLLGAYERHGYGLYRVERKSDGGALGMCGLVKRDSLPHADLGFAFLERFRGQGFALEAARATLSHAHASLGITRLLAIVSPENSRSTRLLGKLGFVHRRTISLTGNQRDLVELWEGGTAAQPAAS
jgi:RimJ/RimL family protein N-acetyltransferase